MPLSTLERSHGLRCQLAAESIDANAGLIRGCTVAKAGVRAIGKVVWLDAAGKLTDDEELAVREMPIFTDAKTLTTLMAAAAVAGDRLKAREDHDDSIGARVGYSDTFKLTDDGRVTADLHLFASYRNRAIVLETARETPDKIGLSIDFIPSFELLADRALMRVDVLEAVDLVDAGAITPGGLLLSATVDSAGRVRTSPKTQSSLKMAATLEDIMTALGEMKTGHAAITTELAAQAALIAKLTGAGAGAAPDAAAKEAAAKEAAAKEGAAASAATLAAVTAVNEKLSAVTASLAQMKKERALLGFRGTEAERMQLASGTAEEIEKVNATKKDYLSLVADRVTSEKCKRTDAHVWVMKNHKAEYAAHLAANGVVKISMAA